MAGATKQVTVGDLELTIMEFSDDENARFDNAWEAIVTEQHRFRTIQILNGDDKEITRIFAQAMKAYWGGMEYMGMNQTTGFGMRAPLPEDVISKAAAAGTADSAGNVWDYTFTAATQGAERGWICDNAPNADSFDNESPVVLRDVNHNWWAFLWFGVRSLHPSPKTSHIVYEVNRKDQVRIPIENQLRGGELSLVRFGTFIWLPPKPPINAGVASVGGDEVLVPVGIIFDTATRSLDRTMGGTSAT